MKKEVLLLGGTGAIGNYLIEELLKQGHKVFVTTRIERKSEINSLIFVTGNARCLNFTEKVVSSNNFDVIVDFMVYDSHEFRPQIQLLLNSTPHYVFLSSYRVYSDAGLVRLNEKSPRLTDNENAKRMLGLEDYAILKAIQEDFIKQSDRKNWTIVRPTMSYSSGRLQLGSLEADFFIPRMMKGLPIAFPRELLDKKTTLTWAGDVAILISGLLEVEEALEQVFLLATREAVSWRQVINIYSSKFDFKINIVEMNDFLNFESDVNKLKFDRLLDRKCDNSKVLKCIENNNFEFLPIESGLKSTLIDTAFIYSDDTTLNRINGKMDRLLNIWQLPNDSFIEYTKYLSGRVRFLDMIIRYFRG